MKSKSLFGLLMMLGWLLGIPMRSLKAQQPIVYAVLFFSPSCGHCHYVIEEFLPSLQAQVGDQLQVVYVDVSTEEGNTLFHAAFDTLEVPEELRGYVPTLVVGDTFLIGSQDIPDRLPALVQEGIAAGGIGPPPVPGLAEILAATSRAQASSSQANPDLAGQDPVGHGLAAVVLVMLGIGLTVQLGNGIRMFHGQSRHQPIGHASWLFGLGLAILTTLIAGTLVFEEDGVSLPTLLASAITAGMLLVVGAVGFATRRGSTARWKRPAWLLPMIAALGLTVAGYLAYVELNGAQAVCGAVGDCNTVQQSAYARLFGLVPIGVLGVVGYVSILATASIGRYAPGRIADAGQGLQLGLVLFGALFSAYLTFLELFVIRATCAWCLTSAMLMLLLLWLYGSAGWEALDRLVNHNQGASLKMNRQ